MLVILYEQTLTWDLMVDQKEVESSYLEAQKMRKMLYRCTMDSIGTADRLKSERCVKKKEGKRDSFWYHSEAHEV